MICPNCGLHLATKQKFCRSCGTSLQAITQRLPEPPADRELQPAKISRPQATNSLLLWGMIVMFLGAATGVIGKMMMHDQMVTLVGVLASLVGMFLAVLSALLPARTRDHYSLPSQPELEITSQQIKSLPEERPIEYVPSITERTTDLLKSSAAKPKRRDENA
jgi:hypothetical protein